MGTTLEFTMDEKDEIEDLETEIATINHIERELGHVYDAEGIRVHKGDEIEYQREDTRKWVKGLVVGVTGDSVDVEYSTPDSPTGQELDVEWFEHHCRIVLEPHRWTVQNVKAFDSPDGGGFSCVLYMDGEKVADCCDGGYGGPVEVYRWRDTESEEAWRVHVASRPKVDMSKYGLDPIDEDEGCVIGRLCDEATNPDGWERDGSFA